MVHLQVQAELERSRQEQEHAQVSFFLQRSRLPQTGRAWRQPNTHAAASDSRQDGSASATDPTALLAAQALTDGLKRRIIRGHNSVVATAKKACAPPLAAPSVESRSETGSVLALACSSPDQESFPAAPNPRRRHAQQRRRRSARSSASS